MILLRRYLLSLHTRFPHLLPHFFLDLLLPLLGFMGVVAVWNFAILTRLSDVLIGRILWRPGDINCSLWYYWWFHHTVSNDLPKLVTPIVCAPAGQALTQHFPNRLDAWLATPFLEIFGFVQGANLFILAIPVLNAMAAYGFFRTLTSWRMLAWGAGLLFGYSSFTITEILGGRPVTALTWTLPLVLWAWNSALEARRARWAAVAAILTGLAGALAFQSYVPNAFFLAFSALLMGGLWVLLPTTKSPYEHFSWQERLRPLWLIPLAGAIGIVLSVPYLHETLVLRPDSKAFADTGTTPREPGELWHPEVWTELLAYVQTPAEARSGVMIAGMGPEVLLNMQRESLPWTWLWHRPLGEYSHRVLLLPVLLLVAALLTPLAGWKSVRWWLIAVLAWIITLGPFAAVRAEPDGIQWLEHNGERVTLPLRWAVEQVPAAAGFLRPYRAFSLVLLAVLALVVEGGQGLLQRLTSLLRGIFVRGEANEADSSRVWVRQGRHLWTAGVSALLGGAAWACLLTQTQVQPNYRLMISDFTPNPGLQALATMPEDFVVVELPMGDADGVHLGQAIHGHRSSEPLRFDTAGDPFTPHPPGCYAHPFLQSLWHTERMLQWKPRPGQANPTPPDAELVAKAAQDGFRYVVVYKRAYLEHPLENRRTDAQPIEEFLTGLLGVPHYADRDVLIYDLKSPTARAGAAAQAASELHIEARP